MPAQSRSPARLAAAIAVPAALVAGVVAFWLLGRSVPAAPTTTPTSAAAPRTAPVPMPARSLDAATAGACQGLIAKLPDAVRNLPRRPVTAGAEQNAAYGEPPLTVACGTPPVTVSGTELTYRMGPVCWVMRPVAGGTAWVTVDRRVPVTVTVPGDGVESGQWASEFASVLAATVSPAPTTAPSGCA